MFPLCWPSTERINIIQDGFSFFSEHWLTEISCVCIFWQVKKMLFAYRCDRGEPFRVQFRLQEKLLRLKGCPRNRWGLCDWSVIKKKYGYISDTCDLSFCFKEMTEWFQMFIASHLNLVSWVKSSASLLFYVTNKTDLINKSCFQN